MLKTKTPITMDLASEMTTTDFINNETMVVTENHSTTLTIMNEKAVEIIEVVLFLAVAAVATVVAQQTTVATVVSEVAIEVSQEIQANSITEKVVNNKSLRQANMISEFKEMQNQQHLIIIKAPNSYFRNNVLPLLKNWKYKVLQQQNTNIKTAEFKSPFDNIMS
jgi:hypothetical protein